MAQVVKAGFGRLADPNYQPDVPGAETTAADEPAITDLTTIEMFAAGLLHAGDLLTTADPENDTIAEVTEDGLISLDEHTCASPRRAARAIGNEQTDGWDYWIVHDDESPRSLKDLAELLPPDESAQV